jgi:rSAM/selenodomain-associated transferase 1
VADLTPLAIFARLPAPGTVKTRLAPELGDEGAARLYRAFVDDTIAAGRATEGLAPELWLSSGPGEACLGLVDDLPVREQPAGDLGERMRDALSAMVQTAGRGLVVGSDCPTLPRAYLRAAAAALAEHDVVIGPSADGGYYAIGARGRVPPLFDGVRWSTRHVLVETRARARREGLAVCELPPWYDVDTPEDLRLLRLHLAARPDAAPATARALGLSG